MTIDEYLDGAPEPQQGTLSKLRATLRRILPDAEVAISYNMPVLKVRGKAGAGFAYFENHCSFFG